MSSEPRWNTLSTPSTLTRVFLLCVFISCPTRFQISGVQYNYKSRMPFKGSRFFLFHLHAVRQAFRGIHDNLVTRGNASRHDHVVTVRAAHVHRAAFRPAVLNNKDHVASVLVSH